MSYVIQSEIQWRNKSGETATIFSFYEKTSGYPLPLNHFVGSIDEAKKFDKPKDARAALVKYLGKKERYKIIKVQNPNP